MDNVRVFIISDSYVVHYFTLNPVEFYTRLADYVNVMTSSSKENVYTIGTQTMAYSEYEVMLRNFIKTKTTPKLPEVKPRAKLKLVDPTEAD